MSEADSAGREIAVETPADARRWFRLARVIAEVEAVRTTILSYSRQLDWALAILALIVGVTVVSLAPGLTVGSDNSETAKIPGWVWGTLLILFGGVRIGGLKINGAWRTGGSAMVRGAASFLCFIFWSTIAFAELLSIATGAGDPVTVIFLGWVAGAEVACMRRALDDTISIRQAGRLAAGGSDGGR